MGSGVVRVLAACLVLLTACGQGRSTSRTEPSPSASGTVSPYASPTPTPRTAADALRPFFAAAAVEDGRIRTAAALVDGGFGATTVRFDQRVLDAVDAADPQPVADAIPVGLPPRLMRAVLLVFGDLVARGTPSRCPSTAPRART